MQKVFYVVLGVFLALVIVAFNTVMSISTPYERQVKASIIYDASVEEKEQGRPNAEGAEGRQIDEKRLTQELERKEDIRYVAEGVSPKELGLPAGGSVNEAEKFRKNRQSILLASRGESAGHPPLLRLSNEDSNYTGVKVRLSPSDRDFVERIVMGEAGGEDYIGKALVAQAIRDAMVTEGLTVKEVWKTFKYTPNIDKEPNTEVKSAVDFIFNGGYVVKHRILYFYAPKIVDSSWHETQKFVIQHGGHRFFDRRD